MSEEQEQQPKPSRWTRLSNRKKMIGGLGAATVLGLGGVASVGFYKHYRGWHRQYYQFNIGTNAITVCIVRNKPQQKVKVIWNDDDLHFFSWEKIIDSFCKLYRNNKSMLTPVDESMLTAVDESMLSEDKENIGIVLKQLQEYDNWPEAKSHAKQLGLIPLWHLHYYQFQNNKVDCNVCIVRNKPQGKMIFIDSMFDATDGTLSFQHLLHEFRRLYNNSALITIDKSVFDENSRDKHISVLKHLREQKNYDLDAAINFAGGIGLRGLRGYELPMR